jgi:hypothetical protein
MGPLCHDALVRATLDIQDDAYQIARTVAREQNRSLSSVVSDFILGKIGEAAPVGDDGGVFPSFRCVRPVTSENVRALADEE